MKILSFGEIIWDVYSPTERTLGGAPLNFAAYAAMMGADVYLASAVGGDDIGREAVESIKKLGIDCRYVSVSDKVTGQCLVTLGARGVPSYKILENVAYDAVELPDSLFCEFDAIAFGTLALRTKENRDALERVLKNNKFAEVYTDLNIRPPFYSAESVRFCLENATVVKISDEELPVATEVLFGKKAEVKEAVKMLQTAFDNVKLMVITCGADGAYCFESNGESHFVPSVPAKVVSTVGAGDSFGAVFLSRYLAGVDVASALGEAAAVASFVVSNKGSIPDGSREYIIGVCK